MSSTSKSHIQAEASWFACHKPNRAARMRLFCFPYAGARATIFRKWVSGLPSEVEVCPVQLPGGGRRLAEPPFTRMEPLVQAIAQGIKPHLGLPFSIFGHSMGAIIGFELTRHLRREFGREPLQLFVSGRRAPQIPPAEQPSYDLPEVEFLRELRRLNGTPTELIEHSELMELVLPVLRADFAVVQTYVYKPGPPLSCPIAAFGGLDDLDVKQEHLEAWREETNSFFTLKMLPGDHFFLSTHEELLLRQISRRLQGFLDSDL